MIHDATPAQTDALTTLCASLDLFQPDELAALRGMLDAHFAAESSAAVWLVDHDEGGDPIGVAFAEPERMTHGTWNLLLLGVHPDRQRTGRGTALLTEVEQRLRKQNERLLLVETAGLDAFDGVRNFYAARGFTREAALRDFYADGVDKVVFGKGIGAG